MAAPKKTEGSIPVIATGKGYYGGKVREIGERFEVDGPNAVSKIWMEQAGKAAKPEPWPGTAPDPDAKVSAKERIEAAKALTGRDDISTAKEADAILASAGDAPAPFSDDAPIEAVED